jgi:hypothetical protein
MFTIIGFLFGVFFIVGILTYTVVSWGFVASVFYSWFILPIFPDMPEISLLSFIGIMFFLTTIFPKNTQTIKTEYTDSVTTALSWILGPWITLICGYFLSLFM